MEDIISLLHDLTEIVSLLKIYRVYDKKGLIPLCRVGKDNDGGYIIPEKALQEADVIMGYGISGDSSFEESASAIYGKRSYGFDGSVTLENRASHHLFYFSPTYIISDAQMKTFGAVPIKYSSFDQHLKIFHLEDKKIFVKMDIESNEYASLPDVLRYTPQITGITFELHFLANEQIAQALHLLQQLQKDFLLVHLHGHNLHGRFQVANARGAIPRLLELSFINKNLVEHFELSDNQSHPTYLDMPTDPNTPECCFEIIL